MAKAKADPVQAALQTALDELPGLLPLIGPKGKGLFPKSQEAEAERAVSAGWLEKRAIRMQKPPGKGKNTRPTFATVTVGVLTESGGRKLAEASGAQELKPVLEAIRTAVGKLGEPAPASNPGEFREAVEAAAATSVAAINSQFRATVEAAAEKCVGAIKTAFGQLNQEVLAAVPSSASTATNPAPILAALDAALNKLQPTVVKVPVLGDASAAPVPPPPAPPAAPPIADEIVVFVTDWARVRTVGPPFDEIMKHLRARHPSLTVGAFHDALRRLTSEHRLKLSGWSKTIHELPEPELALFVKHTVTYYAHPNQ